MSSNLLLITEKGEITKDLRTGEYVVWSKDRKFKICTTPYEGVARAALKACIDNYPC